MVIYAGKTPVVCTKPPVDFVHTQRNELLGASRLYYKMDKRLGGCHKTDAFNCNKCHISVNYAWTVPFIPTGKTPA